MYVAPSPTPISSKLPTGSIRSKVLAGKTMHGVSVTDGGAAPKYPEAAAAMLASYGYNWARLHHLEFQDVSKVLAFADALYAAGIRISVDGASKLGEKYAGGLSGFKQDLYAQVPEAEALYRENIARITPLLQHPGCFMCCLVNEGAHLCTPAQARTFWEKWSPEFRAINPDLLLTDCPDGFNHPDWQADRPEFALVAQSYDVGVLHYYNDDGSGTGTGSNIRDGWNWIAVLEYAQRTGKRILIQEFGSYKSNPNQGSNLMFVMLEAVRRGFSTCQFAFATNEEGWQGVSPDTFTMTNDPLRMALASMSAHVYKYGAKEPYCDVAWDGDNGVWGTSYLYQSKNVLATESGCDVRAGSKTLYWRWREPYVSRSL